MIKITLDIPANCKCAKCSKSLNNKQFLCYMEESNQLFCLKDGFQLAHEGFPIQEYYKPSQSNQAYPLFTKRNYGYMENGFYEIQSALDNFDHSVIFYITNFFDETIIPTNCIMNIRSESFYLQKKQSGTSTLLLPPSMLTADSITSQWRNVLSSPILEQFKSVLSITNVDMVKNTNNYIMGFRYDKNSVPKATAGAADAGTETKAESSPKTDTPKLDTESVKAAPETSQTEDSMTNLSAEHISPIARKVCYILTKLSPSAMLAYCENRIQGQGLQLKKAVYQVYHYLQKIASGQPFQAANWILTAPSGSGKTEFYRTVKALFARYQIPVPVLQIDLSQITEAGFKGSNTSTIGERILAENPDCEGYCICFLDEADKKCIPSYGSNNINYNAAVQSNLLTLIEGSAQKLETNMGTKNFDSGKSMFVLTGSFQDIRNQKQEKLITTNRSMGFCTEPQTTVTSSNQSTDCFHEDITLQEIINYGMLEELAGRMVQIINFHKLSDEDMRKLIRCKAVEISKELFLNISITDEAVEEFLEISFGSLGIRRPMNLIKELAQNTIAEVFFSKDIPLKNYHIVIDSLNSAHLEEITTEASVQEDIHNYIEIT